MPPKRKRKDSQDAVLSLFHKTRDGQLAAVLDECDYEAMGCFGAGDDSTDSEPIGVVDLDEKTARRLVDLISNCNSQKAGCSFVKFLPVLSHNQLEKLVVDHGLIDVLRTCAHVQTIIILSY